MKCHGWLLVLGVLLLSACGKDDESKNRKWASFPVPLYTDASVTNEALADIGDAMAFWESRAGKKLFDFRGSWQGQTPAFGGPANAPTFIAANLIFFQSPWQFSGDIAAQTVLVYREKQITGSLIMLNGNIHSCNGDCQNSWLGSTSMRRVFTHEIGHFLGLEHASDPQNIMYPQIQPGNSLSNLNVDANTLGALTF